MNNSKKLSISKIISYISILFQSFILNFCIFLCFSIVILNLGLMEIFASPNVIEKSVFRITNFQQRPNWQSPWKMKPTVRGQGSGFLIKNNLILTNAHVVSDSRMILVSKTSFAEPFIADVVSVAHDSDLALLKVRESRFYDGLKPLELGGIPKLRSRVTAFGYPSGGNELSRTEGVVSRIEFGTYIHSGIDSHLLIQTDSAINPGNSGGPVTQFGKVIGVAFQSNLRLNDIGYIIPIPLIKRFLKDIQDGKYDGVPEIGIETSSLINKHYRDYLKLPINISGVLIDRVIPRSSADGILFKDDVITRIESRLIDAAGMVFQDKQKVAFFIEAENKQIGDYIEVQVWRNGKLKNLQLKLKPPPFGDEMRNSYDKLPQYLIFGGLVFVALNRNYINQPGNMSPSLAYEQWYRELERPGTRNEQAIVIAKVLPAAVNSGYTNFKNFVVNTVNGIPVKTLSNLKKILLKIPDSSPYIVFKSDWHNMPLVLDYKESLKQDSSILEKYGISRKSNLF